MFRIAGRVVSAMDGHPLQRATVRILTTGDSKLLASTIAGEEGDFAFANLKGGTYYVLDGSASGFIGSRYDAHGVFSTAIINGPGLDTESLVLKLTPEAGIYGRVTDEAGDPVRRASITLYRESGETGIPRTTRMRNAQTDDIGAYEILNLPPGKYFLSATATPWYAIHPQALSGVAGDPTKFQYLMPGVQGGTAQIVDSVDPSLDVAYPVTFYPDATDSSSAAPIQLKAGDQTELDMRLAPQTSITLTIPVSNEKAVPFPAPGDLAAQQEYARAMQHNQTQVQLQRKVFDDLEIGSAGMTYSPTAITFFGVAPGQYVVQQQDPQTNAPVRSIEVNLSERTTSVDLAGGEIPASVPVVVQTVEGPKLSPQSVVMLYPIDPKRANFQAALNEEAVATINSAPGDYYVLVLIGASGMYTIDHTLAGGRPQPGNLVHVSAGKNEPVTVVAITRPTPASLEGFAKSNGTPAPGARVVLLPPHDPSRSWGVWQDQTDLDGSFHLKGVPPGRYALIAIQDGWDLEWQREGVFDPYLPRSTEVVIPPAATGPIKLPAPITVQPR
jgi:hypothetical protein